MTSRGRRADRARRPSRLAGVSASIPANQKVLYPVQPRLQIALQTGLYVHRLMSLKCQKVPRSLGPKSPPSGVIMTRKPYSPPVIRTVGTVHELTQQNKTLFETRDGIRLYGIPLSS